MYNGKQAAELIRLASKSDAFSGSVIAASIMKLATSELEPLDLRNEFSKVNRLQYKSSEDIIDEVYSLLGEMYSDLMIDKMEKIEEIFGTNSGRYSVTITSGLWDKFKKNVKSLLYGEQFEPVMNEETNFDSGEKIDRDIVNAQRASDIFENVYAKYETAISDINELIKQHDGGNAIFDVSYVSLPIKRFISGVLKPAMMEIKQMMRSPKVSSKIVDYVIKSIEKNSSVQDNYISELKQIVSTDKSAVRIIKLAATNPAGRHHLMSILNS